MGSPRQKVADCGVPHPVLGAWWPSAQDPAPRTMHDTHPRAPHPIALHHHPHPLPPLVCSEASLSFALGYELPRPSEGAPASPLQPDPS